METNNFVSNEVDFSTEILTSMESSTTVAVDTLSVNEVEVYKVKSKGLTSQPDSVPVSTSNNKDVSELPVTKASHTPHTEQQVAITFPVQPVLVDLQKLDSNNGSSASANNNPSSSSIIQSSSSVLPAQPIPIKIAFQPPQKQQSPNIKSSTAPKAMSLLKAPYMSLLNNNNNNNNNNGNKRINNGAPQAVQVKKPATASKSEPPPIFSKIPQMNSMVRYQLQKLLKAREEQMQNNSTYHKSYFKSRPVAVLTAYSVKKVPKNSAFAATYTEKNRTSKRMHKLSGRVFYGNFLPIICEQLSAILHRDKFYCPGSHRPCVEFKGQLISPMEFLQKAGFAYTSNWEAIFRAGNGKSLKMLMDTGKLDFESHELFCSGQCPGQLNIKNSYPSVQSLLTSLTN